MEINLKPLDVHLSSYKNKQGKTVYRATTAHGSMEAPEKEYFALSRGLSYKQMPVRLQGSKRLKQKFQESLKIQLCNSHLAADISPFIQNYFVNKSLQDPTKELDHDSFIQQASGRPIIICGAGESLLQHRGFLDRVLREDSALVVAGGSAIRTFEAMGLVPHVGVVCDSQFQASNRISELNEDTQEKMILFASSSAHPAMVQSWGGRYVQTLGLSALPIGDFTEPGTKNIGDGFVGVSSFMLNLATALRSPDITMVGIDMCHYKDGKLYDEATGFEPKEDPRREEIWSAEALILARQIRAMRTQFDFTIRNLSSGRPIEDVPHSCPPPELPTSTHIHLDPKPQAPEKKEAFVKKMGEFYHELAHLNMDNITESPLWGSFLIGYHNIYSARALYTGEYARDSFVLRIEYLKAHLETVIYTVQQQQTLQEAPRAK